MIKKNKLPSIAILLGILLVAFAACKKNEDIKPAAPIVELVHLGAHDSPDSKTVLIDGGIYFEVKINAAGGVKKIQQEIQQKSGYATFNLKVEDTDGYVGLKEIPSFNSHSVIPAGQAPGDYTFKITVTDQLDQITIQEWPLTVKAADGTGSEHHHDE